MNEYVCECDFCGKLFIFRNEESIKKFTHIYCGQECYTMAKRHRNRIANANAHGKGDKLIRAGEINRREREEYIAKTIDGWENQQTLATYPLRVCLSQIDTSKTKTNEKKMPKSVAGWSIQRICRAMNVLGYGTDYGKFIQDVEAGAVEQKAGSGA